MICDSEQTTNNYHGNTGHTCTHTHYLPIILLKTKDDDFDVEKIEIEREKGGKEKERWSIKIHYINSFIAFSLKTCDQRLPLTLCGSKETNRPNCLYQ